MASWCVFLLAGVGMLLFLVLIISWNFCSVCIPLLVVPLYTGRVHWFLWNFNLIFFSHESGLLEKTTFLRKKSKKKQIYALLF